LRVWGRGDTYTRFWWGNLRERDHLVDPDVDGTNIKMDSQEVGCNGGNFLTSCKPVSFSRRTVFRGVNKQLSK
jgi:hypothetical protein